MVKIRDVILIAAVLGVMALGFFLVRRLGTFADENRQRIGREAQEKEPSCAMLTTELSDEELIRRIRTYEETHGTANITLYRDEDELYDELFGGKR